MSLREHVSLREHACVSSRGAQSTELVWILDFKQILLLLLLSRSVSSCICCMGVSCVHPVVVLSAALCMTFSLLMLVEDARGDHMEEVYSRAGLMTALKVAMSVSFCLHHPVAVNVCAVCELWV